MDGLQAERRDSQGRSDDDGDDETAGSSEMSTVSGETEPSAVFELLSVSSCPFRVLMIGGAVMLLVGV